MEFEYLGYQDFFKTYLYQLYCREKLKTSGEERVIFVIHPPVITLGKRWKRENIKIGISYLRAKGIKVYKINRGGDVTFHNPGQLVCYVILNLEKHKLKVFEIVEKLGEIIVSVLREFGVNASFSHENPGVWTKNGKIAAIGMNTSRNVTMHGFALNIHNDLSIVDLINPCGIGELGVTSVFHETGEKVSINAVIKKFIEKFKLFF